MHSIQALIAEQKVWTEAGQHLPEFLHVACICPLAQDFCLVPISDELEHYLRASQFAAADPRPPVAEEMAPGVAALAARLSQGSPGAAVMYVATFFYGGHGGQDALLWQDGRLVLRLPEQPGEPGAWPNSAISRALRYTGVRRKENEDEFDALGLGRYRSNEAWISGFLTWISEGFLRDF